MNILKSKFLLICLLPAFTAWCGFTAQAQAQGKVLRTIDNMNFRPVEESDPLLAGKFNEAKAFYSIRPPAGWKKTSLTAGEKALQFGVRFQDPKNSDCMTLGMLEGGPKEFTIEALSRFRGDYLRTVREKGLGRIVGSDLFHFKHFYCIQVIARNKSTVVLQLLIFDQPGAFLQLAYSVDPGRYHALARAMEASIASLEWPVL